MGGGGVSGAVSYPDYIMDMHGYLLANQTTRDDGAWNDLSLADLQAKLSTSLLDVLVTAINTNPWSTLTLSNPTAQLDNIETQLDLYYSAVTGYDDGNMSDYVTNALLAVSGVSTSDIPNVAATLSATTITDVQTLWDAHIDTMIGKLPSVITAARTTSFSTDNLEELIASASSIAQSEANFSAATTAYKALIAAATNAVANCDLPREINLQAVLVKAANDADENLRAALNVVHKFMDGTLIEDLSNQFAARREIQYQDQLSQFAGQMSDLNAVNSTSFMFGQALLRSEQMREVADFDAQMSRELFQQGLTLWVQTHSEALRAGVASEESNSRHHTAIVNASLDLMGKLQDRGEIKPTDLINAYSQLFSSEVGNTAGYVDSIMRHMGFMRRDNLNENYRRDLSDAEIELQVEQINKAAKEARYQNGLESINNIITNRVQFEQARAALELRYQTDRAQIIALHEEKTNEQDFQEAIWNFNAFRRFGEILAAPSGSARQLQETPSVGREILGTGLQLGSAILGAKFGAGKTSGG